MAGAGGTGRGLWLDRRGFEHPRISRRDDDRQAQAQTRGRRLGEGAGEGEGEGEGEGAGAGEGEGEGEGEGRPRAPDLVIHHGDASAFPLAGADVVFVSSLCFSDATMAAIMRHASEGMRSGGVVATLRLPPPQSLSLGGWRALESCWVKMSWARVQVHVLRKD